MDPQKPQIEFQDPISEIHKKLDKYTWILLSVGFVFIITLIIMVATVVIDSFHINSATYKEYSEKNDVIEELKKTNQELLDQNKKNQETIIELQKLILRDQYVGS